MSDRSKQNPEELLRKAREYVEKHGRDSPLDGRSRKKDKKTKHRRNHEEGRRRKRRDRGRHSDDEDDGKDSKRRKNDKTDRRRSKSGRHRQASDESIDSSPNRGPGDNKDEQSKPRKSHKKGKEASKKKSKDNEKNKDRRTEDASSKKSSRSRSSRRDDDSNGGENKKDRKRQKQPKKDKDEQKSKKHKKKDSKFQESNSNNSNRKDSEETKKISALLGTITEKQPKKKIDSDDYFAYHNHLRLFLYHKDGIYFEDLSSAETHKAFKIFCDKYNSGELEEAYYNQNLTLPEEVMEACKRTKHKWKFNTNVTEQRSLDLIKSGVKKQTEYQNKVPTESSVPGAATLCIPITSRVHAINNRERPMISERKAEPVTKPNTNAAKDKQEAMLKMLGLKAGQKITIAPRK